MANTPRITANWKQEFDARRYARALLALVEQLGEQHQAVRGEGPTFDDLMERFGGGTRDQAAEPDQSEGGS